MYDTYIGDGVYASFDGYHYWLDLRGQDDTTRIAMEPSVFRNLQKWVDELPSMITRAKEAEALKDAIKAGWEKIEE